MLHCGFIKIDRNIINWRWYGDDNTFRVFFHLLLKANFKDGEFETHTIKRGQLVTGLKALSEELSLSIQQVRTALRHLKITNEINIKTTTKYSIITINNYNKYQQNPHDTANTQSTGDQHTANKQLTNNQQQYKKNKKDKNERIQEDSADAQNVNVYDPIAVFESKSMFKD